MTKISFCPVCQKPTVHRIEKREWFGNSEKYMVYSICQECNSENSRWLEDKEK